MWNGLSRTSTSLDRDYKSYENTRESSRLRAEYHAQHIGRNSVEENEAIPEADRVISRFRLLLRSLSFLLAISITSCLGYIVWLYRSTKDHDVNENGQGVWLDVWLTHLKVKPTYVFLGVSAFAAVLSLTIIVANLSKAFRRVTKLSSSTTAIVSGIAVLLWLGFGVWYKIDDWNSDQNMDLTTYVCRQQHNKALREVLGNMSALCILLRYSWWAVLCASFIEVLAIATVVWEILKDRKGPYVKV